MSDTAKTALRELLIGIVRSLVERPDEVAVDMVEGVNQSTLHVRSHPADVRLLIGERGRTADAIRVLVNASAVKRGFGRFNIEFAQTNAASPGSTD